MKIFIYLRSLLMMLLFPLLTLFCSVLMMVMALLFRGDRRRLNWIGHLWTSTSLKMFGVKLRVRGKDHIPAGNCLLLFNHTSFFDIFSLFTVVPVRYGAKIELFSIPIFGAAMRAFGILPIARNNREEVFRVYQEVARTMQPGERFALAPEGSRNKTESLMPFKTGPFVFAIQAKLPIVPVVIKGARNIMPKGTWIPNKEKWTTEIEVRFLPAVETSSYSYESRSELVKTVYEQMRVFFGN
jgi:1-acyl-sn-glycerol-3-phosphate acyltransferase